MRACLLSIVLIASSARAQCDDAALSRAAADLLLSGERSGAALLDAARRAGSDAPVIDALEQRRQDPARRARWLAGLGERRRAPIVCGEAEGEVTRLVLAAPRAGSLRWAGRRRIEVHVEPGLRDARVFVSDGRGSIWQAPAARDLSIPDDLREPLRVQLVAADARGPHPIAELALGEPPPPPAQSRLPLLDRIDWLRAPSASPLRPNRLLARVAALQAERVCAEGRLAHVSRQGDPRSRLAGAGIVARHVGEALARAADDPSAFAALASSPSHHAALVDPRFTDVGVGRAEAPDGVCLAVVLAAWPRPVAARGQTRD